MVSRNRFMASTTTLTLNADQLSRLIDAMEGVAEPLSLTAHVESTSAGKLNYRDHEALLQRLCKAMTRVDPPYQF